MNEVVIHEHAYKHGISPGDIIHAWNHFIRRQHRKTPHEDQLVSVGLDSKGALMEIVAVQNSKGFLIYHALRPPSEKILRELNLPRRHPENPDSRRGRKRVRSHLGTNR